MPALSIKKICRLTLSALTFSTLTTGSIYAAAASKTDAEKTPAPVVATWQFRVAPYLWPIGMNGTMQLGDQRVHVDESFEDILKHLDYAGMLWLEAAKGNFGIFFNMVFATLSDTGNDGALNYNLRSRYSLYTGGVSYTVYNDKGWNISPYTGLRYTHNKNSLDLAIPAINFYRKDNQRWIDPILGVRFIYNFNPAWSITAAGDVGGTNTSTHYSYNMLGLLGYVPQSLSTKPTIYLGYRMLSQTYQTGHDSGTYLWDIKLSGPILGIAFDF